MGAHTAGAYVIKPAKAKSKAKRVLKVIGFMALCFWALVGLLFVAVPLAVVGVQKAATSDVDGSNSSACELLAEDYAYPDVVDAYASAYDLDFTDAIVRVGTEVSNDCPQYLS